MNNKNYEFFLLKQENLRLKEENSKLRKEIKNPKSLLDSAFGIMFSAFLADITFNFLFFFNELLGEKVENRSFRASFMLYNPVSKYSMD